MSLQELLSEKVKKAVENLYEVQLDRVEFQATRKDFEGDITLVVFPMLRFIKGNPEQIGIQIGSYLERELKEVQEFNVIKGFLNLVISDSYYINFFNSIREDQIYGRKPVQENNAVLVEYSSPNTNKPLNGHLVKYATQCPTQCQH